nr:MAG TPA: hypothetical protein [Caudoviricetes sp.]
MFRLWSCFCAAVTRTMARTMVRSMVTGTTRRRTATGTSRRVPTLLILVLTKRQRPTAKPLGINNCRPARGRDADW